MNELPCLKQLVQWLVSKRSVLTRNQLENFLQGEEHADAAINWLRMHHAIGNCSLEKGKVIDFQVLAGIRHLAIGIDHCTGFGEKLGPSNRVFIVYGRDEDALKTMTAFLKSVGLIPITFRDAIRMTGKTAPTTNEILSAGMDNAFAVLVLFTGDDEAHLKSDPKYHRINDGPLETRLMSQPRQNVIFEAGMAWARFPNRTILVQYGKHLRAFSDIAGIHIVQFRGTKADRLALGERLRQAGCRRLGKVRTPQKHKRS